MLAGPAQAELVFLPMRPTAEDVGDQGKELRGQAQALLRLRLQEAVGSTMHVHGDSWGVLGGAPYLYIER